jgi:hypothetical protein
METTKKTGPVVTAVIASICTTCTLMMSPVVLHADESLVNDYAEVNVSISAKSNCAPPPPPDAAEEVNTLTVFDGRTIYTNSTYTGSAVSVSSCHTNNHMNIGEELAKKTIYMVTSPGNAIDGFATDDLEVGAPTDSKLYWWPSTLTGSVTTSGLATYRVTLKAITSHNTRVFKMVKNCIDDICEGEITGKAGSRTSYQITFALERQGTGSGKYEFDGCYTWDSKIMIVEKK